MYRFSVLTTEAGAELITRTVVLIPFGVSFFTYAVYWADNFLRVHVRHQAHADFCHGYGRSR